MNTNPQIKLKRPYQGNKVGDIIRPTGLVKSFLLQNGYGEIYEEQPTRKSSTKKPAAKKKRKRPLANLKHATVR